jgi:hypothetical protein
MPTTAKGANVFRASQGASDHAHAISPELEDDEASEDEGKTIEQSAIPWSPSPPPACHSPTCDQHSPTSPVFASSHKRKYSALSVAQTSASASPHSTPSRASTSSWHKRARKEITGPAALQGLRAELSTFGQTFVEVSTPPLPTLAPSPSRKTKAIQRAQELEEGLDDDKLAALIRVFQADVNAADAYLVIKRDGLRRAWIASTLGGI